MRNAFIRSLTELAEQNPRIWLLTADLGYSVFEDFARRYPERYLNVGVAEQNMTGIAAGLALSGKIPFTYSIGNFATMRCIEQIRNDVCYHHANVKVVAVGGGLTYGSQGYTHHAIEDLAVMSAFRNMSVVAPGDSVETRLLVPQIVAKPGPCYLRLGRAGDDIVHAADPQVVLGKALLVRPGNDLCLISTGSVLRPAVDVAESLSREGIQARVLSMHTIKPLDEAAIESAARETGGIVTIEEHNANGGLGTMVGDTVAGLGLGIRFRKVGIRDELEGVIGSQQFLRDRFLHIAEAARWVLDGSAQRS